jgi:putative phage-type endonuclease
MPAPIVIPVRQRTPAWHAARLNGIGSSEAAILTGDAPWGSITELYAVKAGIIDPPTIDTPATEWGIRLEDVVAGWWAESTGKKVRRANQLLRHHSIPWMLASLDRRVVGENAILEVKTRRYADEEWGPAGSAEIPVHYIEQVQWQLGVTGCDVAYVAVLFAGSDPRPYEIPRDQPMIDALVELGAAFWQCVESGTPPQAVARNDRPAVIPLHDGEIEADETLALGIEGVHNLRAEIKQRKEDLTAAEDAVKTLLGDYTAARAGAYRATYKPQADRHSVTWELVASAYRKRLAEVDPTFDAESIESLFTTVRPGNRPLLVTLREESVNAA